MHRILAALVLVACVALGSPFAQAQAPPPPNQPDLTVDAVTRRAVVDSLCDKVVARYVFPDRAREVAKALRKRLAAKEYDRITSAREFADSLTGHLQAVAHDLHLRVHFRYEPIPAQPDSGPPPESELRRIREQERLGNYGFERIERLRGNVGYLDLREFSADPEGLATAVAAMNVLSHTDALIIDLRRNGGGNPEMIATLLTYFQATDQRLLFNTFYQREGDTTEQWWTSPYVPGPRYARKPVYVLTSPRTGSAAEEFAYDIQTHRLGTLVGAVTAGGANPGGLYRLNDHFAAFIATGRAINPITKTNWEGVGVRPDTLTTPGEALRVAHTLALQRLIDAPGTDADRKEALKGALEEAGKRAADPEDEFVRRPRRRAAG